MRGKAPKLTRPCRMAVTLPLQQQGSILELTDMQLSALSDRDVSNEVLVPFTAPSLLLHLRLAGTTVINEVSYLIWSSTWQHEKRHGECPGPAVPSLPAPAVRTAAEARDECFGHPRCDEEDPYREWS